MSHAYSTPHVCPPAQRGATVWLTGLPSAGKSTIAHGCEAHPAQPAACASRYSTATPSVRTSRAARGYSRDDRAINIRRIGWVAELLARNGALVLVSAIAPFRDVRNQVREAHEANGTLYLEVHVSTPVEVASERDVKGLYARQRVGEISGLTGVDHRYEEPVAPDLVIATHEHPVEESVGLLLDHLTARGLTDTPARAAEPSAEYA